MMLCGDEVQSVIIDAGSCSMRFGTSGQDIPRHVFKSNVGIINENFESTYLLGDSALRCISSNVEVMPIFDVSKIYWDHFEQALNYGLKSCMRIESSEYPLLFNDSHFENTKDKAMLMETVFEKFRSPATYIGKSSCLSSFCSGRTNSVVVEIGASGTKISPVIDGYAIEKSTLYTSRGGQWMDTLVREEIQAKYSLSTWYELNPKINKQVKASFRDYHINDIIKDIKQWMCFVPYSTILAEARLEYYTSRVTIPPYILPDGTHIKHSDSLCSIPEKLFTSGLTPTSSNQNKSAIISRKNQLATVGPPFQQFSNVNTEVEPLHELIYACVGKCDPDIRKDLLANIVVVGGCSCIDGIIQRLTTELNDVLPSSMKPKIASLLPIERLNSSWIGGSILSICGSFQQMWISKAEYEEHGESIINKRLL